MFSRFISILSLLLTIFTYTVLSTPLDLTTRAVAVGQVITHCTVPGTIALTFDDGPSQYTPKLLDVLQEFGVHATFFVNGYHLGNNGNAGFLQRSRREGHQIASHTFDHPQLPSLSYSQISEQMTKLADALKEIIGVAPTYMRPPYLAVNDLVLQVMSDQGYRVISASIDTKDFENDSPDLISHCRDAFVQQLRDGGSIALAHDTHEQTAVWLAREMLEVAKEMGLKAVTVAECLGESEAYWYQ